MKKYVSFSVLLILFNLTYADTKILNDSNTSFSFNISNNPPTLESDYSSGTETKFLKMDDAYYNIENRIGLPYLSYKIALNDTVKPQITFSNIEYVFVKLDLENFQIPENNIYMIDDLGLARNFPTMLLRINPVKMENGKLFYLRNMTITITEKINKTAKKLPANAAYLNQNSAYALPYASLAKLNTIPDYPSGKWFRITISDRNNVTGYCNQNEYQNIFKLSYDEMKDAGLTETSINKNRIFLYSNSNSGHEIDGFTTMPLVENVRFFNSASDNFAKDDFIYFYGNSPSGIEINTNNTLAFSRNPYSFENYYWILIADEAGNPMKLSTIQSDSNADTTIADTEYLYRKEREIANVLKSGNDWYGKVLDGSGTSVSESFNLPASSNDYSTNITIKLKSGTESTPSNPTSQIYDILVNNTKKASMYTSDYGTDVENFETMFTPYNNTVSVKYTRGKGVGYLDYLECHYNITLNTNLGNCLFYAPEYTGNVQYNISNDSNKNMRFFDISNSLEIKEIDYSIQNKEINFTDFCEENNRKTYLMTSESDFSEVDEIEIINSPDFISLYQDKSAQYIIITDESLLDAAQKIADIHGSKVKEHDRLSTFITTQDEIFRQFNGDVKDPRVINSFLKHAYDNWTVKPEYVLLLGDGSYDHREIESETNDLIMTYQQKFFNDGYDYYATDYFFTYISGNDKIPDVAIGRVPASDINEANNYANKLENYLLNKNYGNWHHTVSLIADDTEDPNSREIEFTRDSEKLANQILPQIFTFNKIYSIEYPDAQTDTKYGRSKPAATEAILHTLKKGTVFMNYIGHAGPEQWSQELIFTNTHLPDIDNANMLPIWITLGCTWSKFDDISIDCMPERLITLKNNGGIATLGATRPTYHPSNFTYLNKIINYWFHNDKINNYRIGDVLRNTMNGNAENEIYALLGDPALKVAFPYDSGNFNSLGNDTLQALDNVMVSGITNNPDFNGNAIVTLYDSKQSVTRYYIDNVKVERSYTYLKTGDLLFRGNIKVENGKFSSSFFIPKDINYANDNGKLHIYGWNDETSEEFAGVYENIYFRGSSNVTDSIGPRVEFLKNDQAFYDGGMVTTADQLQLKLTDMHGINLTGKMGHGISVIMDDNDTEDLTGNFSYLENNDTSGVLTIPTEKLEFGNHDIILKAWDNANNSTSRNFNFNYNKSEEFKISKIVNYPNPFKSTTDITFYSTELCEFSIAIYSVSGAKIREFDAQQSSGDGFTRLYWNGKDDFGDDVARGIYFYKIKAKSLVTNQKDTYIGKMVKG